MKRSIVRNLVIGLAVLVAIVLGGAWWLGLFSEPEAEASVERATAAVDALETDATVEAPPVDDLTGTWSIVPNEATFVGYRIQEVLTNIGDFTAVGRTAGVTGTLTAEGTTITAVDVVADLTLLTSDNGARDGQLRRQALETATFPTASFVLTEPIELGSIPAEGTTITATGVGDFTLHGVTRTIELPIEGTIRNGSLIIIGSTEIAMADYDIEPPQAPVVASVDEIGVMELSLIMQRN